MLFAFLFSNIIHSLHLQELSYWNLFTFSSIICISDTGHIIPYLKKIGIDPKLRVLLEGETIVSEFLPPLFYRFLIDQQLSISGSTHYISYLQNVLYVMMGSIGIGVVIACLCIFLLKFCVPSMETVHYGHVLLFLSTGIISYLLAEGYHLSGSLSIHICGLILIHQSQYYLSSKEYPFLFNCLSVLISPICLLKMLFTL